MPRYTVDRENVPPVDYITMGPRKKATASHPFVHHGRHFARTTHPLCSVSSIFKAGMLVRSDVDSSQTVQEREAALFKVMIATIPGLEESLFGEGSSLERAEEIAGLIQKGMSQARSDDTKSLKGSVVDWITPPKEILRPPIPRNVKSVRGFNHQRTGALLCPAGEIWEEVRDKLASGELTVPGDHWPVFIWADYKFDPENPWHGLLRSKLLVTAFKHVFTSPSSVERDVRATRMGNARIHGMKRVTAGSIAYIATQVRFALSSTGTFTRSDTGIDSERFYNSILDHLQNPDEKEEVDALFSWWNLQVFPGWDFDSRPVTGHSALAKLRAVRAQKKAAEAAGLVYSLITGGDT